jgi:hypothetical protein
MSAMVPSQDNLGAGYEPIECHCIVLPPQNVKATTLP